MKKINILIIPLLYLLTLSCVRERPISINEKFIKEVAQEDMKIPSQYTNVILFCKASNNTIGTLDIYNLREIYGKSFKRFSYEHFLHDVFNQKIILDSLEGHKKFQLDESIYQNYKKVDLNHFIILFCDKTGEELYSLKRNLGEDQRNTILYLLFINNYITSVDDYRGAFIIRKNKKSGSQ